MTDLDIDTEGLRAIAERMTRVADTLAQAHVDAHEAARHVGHDHLAGKVRDFADGWRIHRNNTIDEIRALAELVTAVHQTFSDLDSATARELRAPMAGSGGAVARAATVGTVSP